MTPVEAALHLCESCKDSVAEAKTAVAEIHQTIERLCETRRRTEAIRAQVRRRPFRWTTPTP